MRTASILIVGDEILSGEIRDENGPYLIQRLAAAGVRVQRVVACPDREDEIVAELGRLRALADAVVVSGGIGPTHDDVSRPAMARALGVPLVTHVEAEGRIRGFYGPLTTAAELEMARLPQGARLVHGPRTGTFGFAVSGLYGFPGVPFLLKDLTDAIVPEFRGAPLSRAEIFTNLREGEIADCLTETQRGSPEVAIGSYPVFTDGRWIVRVVVRGEDAGRVDACEQGLRAQLEGLSRSSRRA
jgi:molybdenum cofactor synthesis domain-containing protein